MVSQSALSVDSLSGLADIDGPLPRSGAFDWGGTEDGIDLPILDDLALRLGSFGEAFFTLVSEGCLGLRMNSQR